MLPHRPAILSGQKEEPWSLLVVMPPNPSARVGCGCLVRLWHLDNEILIPDTLLSLDYRLIRRGSK
jgi:hypothetical protein